MNCLIHRCLHNIACEPYSNKYLHVPLHSTKSRYNVRNGRWKNEKRGDGGDAGWVDGDEMNEQTSVHQIEEE